MRGVFIRKGSPFYWFIYYDKYDSNRKRKFQNTKILVTKADRQRFDNKRDNVPLKFVGTPELWRKVNAFHQALADRNFELQSGSKLRFSKKLSEGYEEFKTERTVPNSKKYLKKKTLINYDIAVSHMLKACGDKYIYKYTEKDYANLLHYFDALRVKKVITLDDGSNEMTEKKMSKTSLSIYTRSLRALWNFFCDKNYAARNIIEPVGEDDVEPAPIPLDEMYTIIKYFEADEKNPHHYWLLYFLLLTGCRPSSAMVQLKEDIGFKQKIIKITNVKAGKRKKKLRYNFPLYNELFALLKKMGVEQGDTGRLFSQYKLNELSYTSPLSFWERGMKVLRIAKKISDYYTLKQIRPTTASFLVNVLNMKAYTVKELLDHADIKITDKHYLTLNLKKVREEMDDMTLDDLLTD